MRFGLLSAVLETRRVAVPTGTCLAALAHDGATPLSPSPSLSFSLLLSPSLSFSLLFPLLV
jgi:hypothetical protein